MASLLDDITAARSTVLDGIASGTPTSPQERDNFNQIATSRVGELRKGLRRAGFNASSTVAASVGQFAEPFAPNFADRQFDKAEAYQRNMPAGLEAKVASFRDINDLESAASYGAGALGEGLTSVASIVAGSVAARLGLGTAFRLGAAGKNAAQFAGGAAAMFPQEAGETALTLRNNPEAMANTTPLERLGLSAGKGAVASAMESVVPNLVFANAISGTARRIAPGVAPALANVGRKALGGTIGEFATEGSQELAGQVAENIAVPGTGYDFEQALEAAVKGSVTGGVLGGAGGTVQAARSNVEAAVGAAREAEAPAQDALNRAVEGIDNIIRNPEQAGIDLTDATMGMLAEAQARAGALGEQVSERAGPAAASGMEAIAGMRAKFDDAVGGKLTPENVRKYAELKNNFRLLSPVEYSTLRDALETGDGTQINEAVGSVSKLLAERVPRETLEGLKSIASWSKKFGAGVTRAAQERRAAVKKYGFEDQKRFLQSLQQSGHGDVIRAIESGLANPVQVVNQLMTLRAREENLNLKDNPVHRKLADGLRAITRKELSDIIFDSTEWQKNNTTEAEKAGLSATQQQWGNKDSQIVSIGERAKNLLIGDALIAQAARDGVDLSGAYNPDNAGYTTSVPESERGTLGGELANAIIRDEDDNVVDLEDRRRTAYNSLRQIKSILGADVLTREDGTPIVDRKTGELKVNKDAGFTLPATLSIAEVVDADGDVTQPALPPAFIGRLLGGKESRSLGYDAAGNSLGFKGRPMGINEDTLAMRTTEDGRGYKQEFNTIDMAAQAGTPNERQGSKENSAGYVDDFDGTYRDLNIQGYRLLAVIASMHTDGIDIPRSEIDPALLQEFGLSVEGDDIHIDVDMPPNSLNENTVVQRGKKNSTIGDLTGLTRARRSLPRQLELLLWLTGQGDTPFSPDGRVPDSVAAYLQRAVRKEKDQTADATLTGLESFAMRSERVTNRYMKKPSGFALDALLDAYVFVYIEDLQARIENGAVSARAKSDAGTLYGALTNELITPDKVTTAIAVLEDPTIEDDTNAVRDLRYGLELEAATDKELVDTLIFFRDGVMGQWELSQEAFNQEPVSGDTAAKEFDAWKRGEGGMTRTSQRGMGEQKDADVRRSTTMTIRHENNFLRSLPESGRTAYRKQVINGQVDNTRITEQRRLEMEMPFTFDGRMYDSIEHAHVSYGSPDAAKGETGVFSQRSYDNYRARRAEQQAELTRLQAERDANPATLGRIADQRAENKAAAELQAQLEMERAPTPYTGGTLAPTYPVTPRDADPIRTGWSRELGNALAEATTPEAVQAAGEDAVRGITDPVTIAGIDKTVAERLTELQNPQAPVPAQTQQRPTQETRVAEPVNVWAGTNENAALSNLKFRPFTYEGREYLSVEHAYQSLKTGTFDETTYNKYNANYKKNGKLGKIAGNGRANTAGDYNITVMENLIRESFAQNPAALVVLQATGDRPITHTQDKGIWAREFPRILMKIRDEGTPAAAQTQQQPTRQPEQGLTAAQKVIRAEKAKQAASQQQPNKIAEGVAKKKAAAQIPSIPMYYKMPVEALRAELKSLYPKGTTTAQLIADGHRTATTRASFLEVGRRFTIKGVPNKLFEVTAIERVDLDTAEGAERWSQREGWSTDYAGNFGKQVRTGALQTVFKEVATEQAAQTQTPPVTKPVVADAQQQQQPTTPAAVAKDRNITYERSGPNTVFTPTDGTPFFTKGDYTVSRVTTDMDGIEIIIDGPNGKADLTVDRKGQIRLGLLNAVVPTKSLTGAQLRKYLPESVAAGLESIASQITRNDYDIIRLEEAVDLLLNSAQTRQRIERIQAKQKAANPQRSVVRNRRTAAPQQPTTPAAQRETESAKLIRAEKAKRAAQAQPTTPAGYTREQFEKVRTRIAAVTDIDVLDTLQAELLTNPVLTIDDATLIQETVEARRAELEAEPLGAFEQRIVSGKEYTSKTELLGRIVNKWAKKYLGGAEVRLVEFDPTDPDVVKYFQKRDGQEADATGDTRIPKGRAVRAGKFGPNSPAIILLKKTPEKPGESYRRMHVLAHEFGHVIDHMALENAPAEVKAGIDRAYQRLVSDLVAAGNVDEGMFNAGSVLRFVRDKATDTVMTNEDTGAAAGTIDAGIAGRKEQGDTDYILSKQEFFAEQFAKYAMKEPNIFAKEGSKIRQYLDDIIAEVKKFYREVILQLDKTAPEFDTFMKWLGTPAAERPAFPDYNPQQWDTPRPPVDERNPPPIEGTVARTPPRGPPQGPQDPPSTPPPPPNNAAREKFIAIVKRLLGNRVNVEFDVTTLPEGIAADYQSSLGQSLEDTAKALKAVREQRRDALQEAKRVEALLRDPSNKIPFDELPDPARLREQVRSFEKQEQAYLADLAVRGTIRVAAGMEAQAGLAEHEAFHAAFAIFFGADNAADRKVIITAFTRGVLANRLRKYFAGNDTVLAVIDPANKDTFRAEEAAAYAFEVFLHEPGALQMGEKVEGIFNRFLAYLQKLVGYQTYEQRAKTIFNDLNSGRRAERGVSVLRNRGSMETSMLERSQEFVRELGTGVMHLYDTVLSSSYSRLEGSGNPAMAQIARLGYNQTGQRGQGMSQLLRLATTKYSNHLKEALHASDQGQLDQLNRAMILGDELSGRLGEAQGKLREILAEIHQYQRAAGVDIGFKEDYYPMIWNPEKVAANAEGFIKMLTEKYPAEVAEMNKTPDEILDSILAYEELGGEFQGIFNKDGEPTADSARKRSLDFIKREDRVEYMEDDLVVTMAHYINQSVRHTEFVRAYGENGSRLKELMGEITGTYGGTQADVALTKDYIDGLMGDKEIGMSRELKDLYGAMVVYQNVRLLPLSTFSSLVDPLGIGVRTQSATAVFDTFAYSVRNMFADFRNKVDWTPDQWETYASDIGTVDMSGTVKSIDKLFTGVTLRGKTREINDTFFKWNLLNGWVKNNHIMATKYAQLYLRRNAEGMFGEKMSAENLQEVGLRPEEIMYDETLGRIKTFSHEFLGYESAAAMELAASKEEITEARAQADRIQQAVNKIVRQSLIQPVSAEMSGWMSNPYLAPIAHLKTFVFGFNATILQRLLYEAQRGNYSPIYYAAAYVPGMIAADFIKGFAGNGGEEPEWKKNWTMGDYVDYGVDRSGLLGTGQFFRDIGSDVTRGGGGWETLSGPTIEQATDLIGAMSAKTSEPTRTWVVDALPANALYNQWVMP